MKDYTTEQIRNIALIGHGDAGKTSIAEAIAFSMGIINRMGSVPAGNTVSDYNADEIERQISISSSIVSGEWDRHKINLVDVPGYSDFIGESRGAIRVVETVALVMQAVSGIEVGVEQGWRSAEENEVPRIFIINKLDREQADFKQALAAAQGRYGRGVVAAQFPVDQAQPGFHTIIDVILMKQLSFATDGSGKMTQEEIPNAHRAGANELREKLVEAIAESSDELLEAYLENGELTAEQFAVGLKAGINNRTLFPVFCLAASANIGVHRLLDAICKYLPAPADFKEVVGKRLTKGEEEVRRPITSSGPNTAFVFKTVSEPHVGELSFIKVYTGTIASGMDLLNATTNSMERIGNLFAMNGKTRHEISQVVAGDIGAVVKLKSTHTGDTLCDKNDPIILPPIAFPKPSINVALIPKARADEEKISEGLNRLREEDPSFRIIHDPELSQMILSGQGELHINIIVKRLKDKFGVEVNTKEPRIPYRETIRGKATVKYRHKKQSGGAGQFAEVQIMLQSYREEAPPAIPSEYTVRGEDVDELPWGGKLSFVNCIIGGVIDGRFIPAVKKGVLEMMQQGVVAGCPIRDVQIILFDGMMHSVDSNENAFKTAGRMAFKNAFQEAKPVLHEPICNLTVNVPEEYMGDVMGDLSGRRGKILGMEGEGGFQTVKARVPLAELYRYSTKLRSMTSGRGGHEIEISHYEEVPREIADRIIEQIKSDKEEEK
ncbi:MAG: elongation factor G [Deltaproteobacteria bacterium]|nr:elongation factor G [Deltaproteobacteria bacterium]